MGIEKSRPVLITGCSTGIGRATAELLADEGYNVHATARRLESIEDLAAKGMKTHALDVTNESSMEAAVAEVEQDGPVGALVNNAGYSQSGAIETIPMESVRKQFETNVFGLIRMCQLVLPSMRRAGSGRIVNLSSMGGKVTFPGGGIYHATKFAVEGLSDVLRFEVREFGVDVVVIEPGLIVTDFGATAAGTINEVTEHGPYAKFNAEVGTVTANAYEGPMARLGAGPEAVAKKISKALSANRPSTRYKVTASARVPMAMRRLVSDRMWDRMMRSQFSPPKPEG
ncbi:MAG TPA: oxidoreductase [Solirubrobacterales bacterium]|jgi:short-subunit dehydrogenase|nr:oxidoreductase [Solirubrobacterales bacterium]